MIKFVGMLEVIGDGKTKGKSLCRCKCGNTLEVSNFKLSTFNIKDCGCGISKSNRNKLIYDMTGKEYDNWNVIEYVGSGKYRCECKLCGNRRIITGYSLREGRTKSCGCWQRSEMKDKVFGNWLVLSNPVNNIVTCKCLKCNSIKEVDAYSVRRGLSKSCGCSKYIDLSKQEFGYLTVRKRVDIGIWECECKCGTIKNVLASNLISGHTRSCGCKTRDISANTMIKRYGDTSTYKIDNPRENWKIDTLRNKDKLASFIESLECEHSWNNIASELEISTSTLRRYIERYDLFDLIDNSTVSKYEEEIVSMYDCKDIHNRTVLNGKEIDMYFDGKKLAIEFNGNYWHSDLMKEKNYHRDKTLSCMEKGIHLIHII